MIQIVSACVTAFMSDHSVSSAPYHHLLHGGLVFVSSCCWFFSCINRSTCLSVEVEVEVVWCDP